MFLPNKFFPIPKFLILERKIWKGEWTLDLEKEKRRISIYLLFGGSGREKKSPFLEVFHTFLGNDSLDFDEILQFSSLQWYLAPSKNSMFIKNLVWAVHMYENSLFQTFFSLFCLVIHYESSEGLVKMTWN